MSANAYPLKGMAMRISSFPVAAKPSVYGGLGFTAETNGATISMTAVGSAPSVVLETSTDGTIWMPFTVGSTMVTLSNVGDTVYFRAGQNGNARISNSLVDYNNFVITGRMSASGNINSLLSRDYDSVTKLVYHCYNSMFYGCTGLTTAPALPATILANNCYHNLFKDCTSLTTAPSLPAMTLANQCYNSMFYGCTGLTTPPALPATTLFNYCYLAMFNGCSSLVNAPSLPATTLVPHCYQDMFTGCSNLTTVSDFRAETLAVSCCQKMFSGCSSLTTAPSLKATTLAQSCYARMFQSCYALATAPVLPATELVTDCYTYMFAYCNSLIHVYTKQTSFTGCTNWLHDHLGATFHCTNALTIPSSRSISNVPSKWSIDKTYL